MLRTTIATIALAVACGGCGDKVMHRACMGGAGGGDNPLLTGAALLRLDVFGADAHCDGGLLAPGAGAAIMSHSYARGEPITLDIPPGQRTLVLTTYADAAGTNLLGVGCTEADLTAGAQVCFDLTLVPAPDMGVPLPCTATPDSCPMGSWCDGTTCRAGCKAIAHSNGWGGTYLDCAPLGQPGVAPTTYSAAMANEAAFSDTAQSGTPSGGWLCGAQIMVNGAWQCDPMGDCTASICKPSGSANKGACTCWVYDATGAYAKRIGHTYHSSGTGGDSGCLCPFDTDPTWN